MPAVEKSPRSRDVHEMHLHNLRAYSQSEEGSVVSRSSARYLLAHLEEIQPILVAHDQAKYRPKERPQATGRRRRFTEKQIDGLWLKFERSLDARQADWLPGERAELEVAFRDAIHAVVGEGGS